MAIKSLRVCDLCVEPGVELAEGDPLVLTRDGEDRSFDLCEDHGNLMDNIWGSGAVIRSQPPRTPPAAPKPKPTARITKSEGLPTSPPKTGLAAQARPATEVTFTEVDYSAEAINAWAREQGMETSSGALRPELVTAYRKAHATERDAQAAYIPPVPYDRASIKAWADSHGMEMSHKGPVPVHVMTAYRKAHSPSSP